MTAGARYQFARDGESTYQNYFYDYADPGLVTSVGHFYTFLPKFAVSYDITPNNTIYANASKGFRLGSENRRIPFMCQSDAADSGTPSYDLAQLGIHANTPSNFGPDKLWNLEIGDKGRLFSGRVTFSGDFFYIFWDDIQTEIPLVTSGDEFQTNAGSATSYGAEFELRTQVNDDLTMALSGSVVNATLDRGVILNGQPASPARSPAKRSRACPTSTSATTHRYNFRVSGAHRRLRLRGAELGGFESHGNVIDHQPGLQAPLLHYAGRDGRPGCGRLGGDAVRPQPHQQQQDHPAAGHRGISLAYLRLRAIWATQTRNLQGFTLTSFYHRNELRLPVLEAASCSAAQNLEMLIARLVTGAQIVKIEHVSGKARVVPLSCVTTCTPCWHQPTRCRRLAPAQGRVAAPKPRLRFLPIDITSVRANAFAGEVQS